LPEGVEAFLQEVGAGGLEIVLKHLVELEGLVGGEVLRSFQKAVFGLLENGIVSIAVESGGFVLAHLINGLAKLLGDVKAVEHVEGLGQHLGDDVEVWLPHVGAHDLDVLATLLAEVLEEAAQGVGLAVLEHAEQALTALVDLVNQRHVVMALAVGDLIDAESLDVV